MKTFNFFLILIFCLCTFNIDAQINIKDKLKRQTNNRANKNVDQGINKGLDAVENGVKDLFKKKNKDGQDSIETSNEQGQDATQNVKPDGKASPSLAAYSKFDFIPGEKVIFYEDFSQDAIGDFPALWNTNGSGEVVTTNLFPGNWLQFKPKSYTAIWTDQLLKLPDNYTIEFDIIPTAGNEGNGMAGYMIRLFKCKNERAWDGGAVTGDAGFVFHTEYYGTPRYRAYINAPQAEHIDFSGSNDDEGNKQKINQKYHISIWVQKTRLRLYLNESKLFDLPRAISTTSKFDRFRIDDGAGLISNIRIAVGAPDMRNKLMTEGKLVTYGIYFDVNKDIVKPESYGTLKEIAKILNEVPDVKVKIVGHTDADGQDAANLDLSKRRAASVKAELAKSFGVNADRLETDGMGESQPVAPNDTPANKALNRRVEFIKL
ncbi:MAG: OmpA family protein [Prolixibacteraceae bacterium]|nr:OmpA family protein [Prolixibacteraceae bacterium]